jgi:hypothetical protein
MEREMAKKANLERQADLKRDADKLLTLAKELRNLWIRPTRACCPWMVKKAEEIEAGAQRKREDEGIVLG